jgi:hypothetical protein
VPLQRGLPIGAHIDQRPDLKVGAILPSIHSLPFSPSSSLRLSPLVYLS